MPPFDITTISDEGLRREYQFLESRADNIARSVSAAYGAGRKPIAFRYINESEFNAYAGEDGNSYTVEVNASMPLFGVILFSRLLSDAAVFPFLDAAGMKASDYALPFIIDPADFDRRVDWQIKLNGIRAFAASTIADICSTFVICHEVGHIMSGHVEGIRFYERRARVAELVSRARIAGTTVARRQAWEYDADVIAASLLIQFIDQLIEIGERDARVRAIFCRDDGRSLEHTLAIVVAGLFAYFSYVQGMRHKLDKSSSHPAPIVRAHYLKDMLFAAVRDRNGFDAGLFHALLDERVDEMLIALEQVELFNASVHSEAYIDDIESELERLQVLQRQYRPSCARWTWIGWD